METKSGDAILVRASGIREPGGARVTNQGDRTPGSRVDSISRVLEVPPSWASLVHRPFDPTELRAALSGPLPPGAKSLAVVLVDVLPDQDVQRHITGVPEPVCVFYLSEPQEEFSFARLRARRGADRLSALADAATRLGLIESPDRIGSLDAAAMRELIATVKREAAPRSGGGDPKLRAGSSPGGDLLKGLAELLKALPSVRDAAVFRPTPERLVAFVVPAEPDPSVADAAWQELWDEVYSGPDCDDLSLDTTGWTSSFTQERYSDAEMVKWLDGTVRRVLSYEPQSFLDVGCGTGLVLLRVGREVATCWGVDPSPHVVDQVRRAWQALDGRAPEGGVVLGAGEDLSDVPDGQFDVVLVNSVIQYLGGTRTLRRVLEETIRRVRPGGHLILGDIRSLPLLSLFHTSVALRHLGSSDPAAVAGLAAQRISRDRELVLDPRLFVSLPQVFPQISDVRVQPRIGTGVDEMTLFRYDVTVRVGGHAKAPSGSERSWGWDVCGPDDLREFLSRLDEPVRIADIPNPRYGVVAAAQRMLGVETDPVPGLHPDDLIEFGAGLGVEVVTDWSVHDASGRYAAYLIPRRDTLASRDHEERPS
mgnify:CR=1 FL=1